MSGTALILELLAPAQLAVGLHWRSAKWTVADEHAATAVIDAALAAIESSTSVVRPGGAVLVACAVPKLVTPR
ncbi:MAG: B12-binding domain-containing protein [Mycobacteriales bacterium]